MYRLKKKQQTEATGMHRINSQALPSPDNAAALRAKALAPPLLGPVQLCLFLASTFPPSQGPAPWLPRLWIAPPLLFVLLCSFLQTRKWLSRSEGRPTGA